MRVGDTCRCPKDHEARIVWISEDRKTIAVKCPQRHFSKVAKVADNRESPSAVRRFRTKEENVFVRDMVFLVRV